MLSPRLLALAVAALRVSAQYSLPPALQAAQDSANSTPDVPSNLTDIATILQTAGVVDQYRGAPTDSTRPGLSPPPTMMTALDGKITLSTIPDSNSTAPYGAGRRDVSDYELIFDGTATNDAAVQGTAYLTFTLVSNTSFEQGKCECLDFCDKTEGCVFVNLYYEFNNTLLDFVFPEKSNLRCVLFGDVHTAAEKTDYGNRYLAAQPSEGASIQNSSGYASLAVMEPTAPEGYTLVFGPVSAANNAPGYMGFAFLDKYDPSACATLCNQRGPDPVGGACKYFNIWRAVVRGRPRTYTCAMYSAPTDASTAVNTGQGSVEVTLSRGYARISHIADGDFEAYTCGNNDTFCFAEQGPGWVGTSSVGGYFDATVFHYAPYAHGGAGVGLLGCAYGRDPQPGTLTPSSLGRLARGRKYVVQFFHSSTYSGEELEEPSFVEVWWNGEVVGIVRVGYSPWTYFEFTVIALGGGNDTLLFKGGKAPAYDFIDDVCLFLL
ncbi:hypothetical protein B0H13DRAFT_2141735 [Mycena leptocephala]|nr:hypothetical protein B0H13DRAFT_2141735 [Mycena leptocephala]